MVPSALCRLAALMLALIGGVGCASTTVKKDPGQYDRGVRFYRPKPYLMITPLDASKVGNVGPDEMVEMKLDWLPDFSEEYSVRFRTGIGANKSNMTLENGWKLTALTVDTDAKFKDNLGAINDIVKTVATSGIIPGTKNTIKATGDAEPSAAEKDRPNRSVVRATNVPIGYYESVIGCGPTGKKQMFGWRYIGFAPFAACPIAPSGGDNCPCDPNQMYGLVFEQGVMTFKLLGTVGHGNLDHTFRPIAMPPAAEDPKKAAESKTKKDAIQKVLTDGEIKGTPDSKIVIASDKVTITLTITQLKMAKLKTAEAVKAALIGSAELKKAFGDKTPTIEVKVEETE